MVKHKLLFRMTVDMARSVNRSARRARAKRRRKAQARRRRTWKYGKDKIGRALFRAELLGAQQGRCGICGELMVDAIEPLDIDHIIPVSHDGTSHRENLQLVHRRCNRQKGNSLPQESSSSQFPLIP